MLNMSFFMLWHMLIGSVVVVSGAMALLLSKGSSRHKLAGKFFVGTILLMGPIIATEAWLSPDKISSLGVLFVFFIIYLVVSGWPVSHLSKLMFSIINIAVPLGGLCIAIAGMVMGFDRLNNPIEGENLPPVEAFFFFATIAFVAMLLDINNIKKGGLIGKHRIIRHVWRMSFALFFATSTLFTGPGSIVFPESIRGNALLSIPQYLVVMLALFWIYRLLFLKHSFYKNITSVPE